MTAATERWAVIGGGMLGMTLAHRFAQQGRRVTLIEAARNLGGLASAWQLGDVVWDRHYHVTLLSDRCLRAMLGELGLASEMEWRQTRTGVYAGGRLYSVSDSLELLRFPVLGLVDKVRLAATVFYGSKIRDGRRLEKIPVTDWLARWSGRRVVERFWLPLLRSKLGESYRETSAAFIWATIARLYAARRTRLKKEMFGYVPGGYARVLERFADVLRGEGVRIELGRPVERVMPRGGPGGTGGTGGASGRDGAVEVSLRGGEAESFDQVVVTLPAPLAGRVCAGLGEDERARLAGVRYLGIVCASVLLRRPLAGFYVTNLLDPGLPFTGVVEMTALVDPRQLGGHFLAYLPRYLAAEDPFFTVPDAEVETLFLEGLARLYPDLRREDVLAFRVSRVRNVMALATLDYSARLPPIETSVPGLHIVNSAQIVNGTLNVNETMELAERAARQLGGGAPVAAARDAARSCWEDQEYDETGAVIPPVEWEARVRWAPRAGP